MWIMLHTSVLPRSKTAGPDCSIRSRVTHIGKNNAVTCHSKEFFVVWEMVVSYTFHYTFCVIRIKETEVGKRLVS